jgi:cytochrome c peroxidase
MSRRRARALAGGAVVALVLVGCGGGTATPEAPAATELSEQAALGELIFKDTSLSASGRQACASCHVEGNAHSPDNALPAQMGGPLMDLQGPQRPRVGALSRLQHRLFFRRRGHAHRRLFLDVARRRCRARHTSPS